MSANIEASFKPLGGCDNIRHHAMFVHMLLNQLTQLLLLGITAYCAFTSEGGHQALLMMAFCVQGGILFITRVAVLSSQAVRYKLGESFENEVQDLCLNVQVLRCFFIISSVFVAALSHEVIRDLLGYEIALITALFVMATSFLMDNSIKDFGRLGEGLVSTPSVEKLRGEK